MTPSEFKAWFEGFRAGIGDRAPTGDEWKLACQKAGGIVDAAPVYPLAPVMPAPIQWPYDQDSGPDRYKTYLVVKGGTLIDLSAHTRN